MTFYLNRFFFNFHIKIDNKSFLKKKWLEKGISQICVLVKENGKFLQFNEMYQLNVCVLEHYGVIMIHILLNKQLQERQQLYLYM